MRGISPSSQPVIEMLTLATPRRSTWLLLCSAHGHLSLLLTTINMKLRIESVT